jgi:single-stranded-DNA-specific exonuclease
MSAAPVRARWKEREASADVSRRLAADLRQPEPVARVLVGRGIDATDTARRFLAPTLKDLPDPSRLRDMDAAVERLLHALDKGEKVGIFGDYDVDGVTSTTLLWDFLGAVGAEVTATVPDRLREGYGLSRAGVDRLVEEGAKLIVTVDCGVTAHEEVDYACDKGVDVIVIDHHTVPVTLPRAVAVINPHRPDCDSGAHHLCAVGVTFNLCLALRRTLRARGWFTSTRPEPDLRHAVDLVALGTVADVVPLIDDNRILVSFGLRVIGGGGRPGMRALLDVAKVDPARLGAGHLGFQLGPRINAAGRLGDAMTAVRLLRSDHPAEALRLAEGLDAENAARRDLERRITEEAIAQATSSAALSAARIVVVGSEQWHPGVVGIVASRLVERFGKPAVVVGEGGRGSGRSIPKFHLYDALLAVSEHLAGFGGHQHAAGVRVPEGGFERFRDELIAHTEATLSADALGRVHVYDGVLNVDQLDTDLVASLQVAAPYGRNNPEPVFRFNGVQPTALRELNGGHFKALVSERPRIEAIQFGAIERIEEFSGHIDILATPEINEWRGSRTLQLRLRDFAAAGSQ